MHVLDLSAGPAAIPPEDGLQAHCAKRWHGQFRYRSTQAPTRPPQRRQAPDGARRDGRWPNRRPTRTPPMRRQLCAHTQPISQITSPGARSTALGPCRRHRRWSAPIWPPPAKATRCRRCAAGVAAIVRACGLPGQPLDTKHPSIRETPRGIARKHGAPARRSAALTTAEIRKLSKACGTGLAGGRDSALILIGFAGALPFRVGRPRPRARHLDAEWYETAD